MRSVEVGTEVHCIAGLNMKSCCQSCLWPARRRAVASCAQCRVPCRNACVKHLRRLAFMFSVGAGKDIISPHFSSCVFSRTFRDFRSAESAAEKMASGEVLSMLSVNRAGSILAASVVDSPSSHSAKSRSTKTICESKSRTVAEPAMSIGTSSACECWLNQSCQRCDSCCAWSRSLRNQRNFLEWSSSFFEGLMIVGRRRLRIVLA